MITRIGIRCLACKHVTSARVQIGYQKEQPAAITCPGCTTPLEFTLLLSNPPAVGLRFDVNCEGTSEAGTIVNVSDAFLIPKEFQNNELHFPFQQMFHQHMSRIEAAGIKDTLSEIRNFGGLANAPEIWSSLRTAVRFKVTNQEDKLKEQIKLLKAKVPQSADTLDSCIFPFLVAFLLPESQRWLDELGNAVRQAKEDHPEAWKSMSDDFNARRIERLSSYAEIGDEYFRSFNEYNQTLYYVRTGEPIPVDVIAMSTNFDRTRMFYGNAFETLGTLLDLPAALNNVIAGRPHDQMINLSLDQYRQINKANRRNCFPTDSPLLWLSDEYDSTIRNASHHRWFQINDRRDTISYRSGGNGALRTMTYTDYLYRCNRLIAQIMVLWSIELLIQADRAR